MKKTCNKNEFIDSIEKKVKMELSAKERQKWESEMEKHLIGIENAKRILHNAEMAYKELKLKMATSIH